MAKFDPNRKISKVIYKDAETPEKVVELVGDVPIKDVNFIDFDGTVLYSYTKEQAMALSALPDPPDHSTYRVPLTFDEWNWSIDSIKTQLTEVGGKVWIGATYHPTDGLHHLIADIDPLGNRMVCVGGSRGSVIDWGDGTSETITSSALIHIYAEGGQYEVTVNGRLDSLGNSSLDTRTYSTKWSEMYLSPNFLISSYSYSYMTRLRILLIPKSDNTKINNSCFNNSGILSVTFPKGIAKITDGAFGNNKSLRTVSIPDGVTEISSFTYCYALKNVTIPYGVIKLGSYGFFGCSMDEIKIPNTVQTIDQHALDNCSRLRELIIPSGVQSIGYYGIANCVGLQSVEIPESVTSIESSAFRECPPAFIVKAKTPPTIQSDSFDTLLSKIIVPVGYLSVYQNATNWSKFAGVMEDGYTADTVTSASHEVISSVSGFSKTVTIKSTYVTSGYDIDGNRFNDITVVRTLDYPISPNDSDQPLSQTVTIEYLNYTGTVTVVVPPKPQMAFTIEAIDGEYPCTLSSLSSPIDGYLEFESTNQTKGSTYSSMKLTSKISGDVSLYIRSDGESNCDYSIISKTGLNPSLYSGKSISYSAGYQMADTSGKQKSGNTETDFIKVDYTGLNVGDVIIFTYRKDSSVDRGTDTGYILIPTM